MIRSQLANLPKGGQRILALDARPLQQYYFDPATFVGYGAANGSDDQQRRWKHSTRQINRLFRKNPARLRVEGRLGVTREPVEPLKDPAFPPIFEPKLLPNGWSAPPSNDVEIPKYPFRISRTKNKPNDAIGFLPVYSEFRKDGARVTTRIKKISGDTDAFLSELRAVLKLPKPKNFRDDEVRVRTGGTVEVKGNRVVEVKTWLAGLGF